MTTKKTPWLGPNHDISTRPVQTANPTPQQIAETIIQEMKDPGWLVSFYGGDVINVEQALLILSNAVLKDADQ